MDKTMKLRRMGRWLAAGLVAAALGSTLVVAGCRRRAPDEADAVAVPLSEERPPNEFVTVEVAPVERAPFDETLAVTGSIIAGTDVDIASKIAGKVIFVGAEEGERVGVGETLVRLESTQAQAELKRAQGALDSAQAQLDKARINQNVVEVSSETNLRAAEAALAAARARLAQAEEGLKIARTRSGRGGVDVETAQANLASANAALAQAEERLAVTRTGTNAGIDSAEAALESARSRLRQSESRLAQSEDTQRLTDIQTQAAIDNAQQAVLAAQNSLAILRTGARGQERAVAQSQVEAARAAYQTAQTEYERARRLFEAGAIAKAQLDNAELMLSTRREQLAQAEQQASLVTTGARPEEITIAETQLRQAEQRYQEAVGTRERQLQIQRENVSQAEQAVDQAQDSVVQAESQLSTARAAVGEIAIAEQAVSQAEEQVRTAEQAVRLAEAGYSQEAIARYEVDAARTQVRSAQAALQLAEANRVQPRLSRQDINQLIGLVRQSEAAVQMARANLRDHVIGAPISGSIAEKMVEVGEVVSPGQRLFRLVSANFVEFEALVPEEKVRFVSPGDSVAVSVDALPSVTLQGRVLEVLPTADPRSRTFTVKIGVENPDGRLREGMFARGEVVIEEKPNALWVPMEALERRGEQQLVYKIEGGNTAVPVDVTTGASRDGMVEITDGALLPGDRVVVQGASELTGEQQVQIVTADGPGEAPGEAPGGPPGG